MLLCYSNMCSWFKEISVPKHVTPVTTHCSEWWVGLKHVKMMLHRALWCHCDNRSGEKLCLFWAAFIPYGKEALWSKPAQVSLLWIAVGDRIPQDTAVTCWALLSSAGSAGSDWAGTQPVQIVTNSLSCDNQLDGVKMTCAVILRNWRFSFTVSAKHVS